jgi:hypothetical protein
LDILKKDSDILERVYNAFNEDAHPKGDDFNTQAAILTAVSKMTTSLQIHFSELTTGILTSMSDLVSDQRQHNLTILSKMDKLMLNTNSEIASLSNQVNCLEEQFDVMSQTNIRAMKKVSDFEKFTQQLQEETHQGFKDVLAMVSQTKNDSQEQIIRLGKTFDDSRVVRDDLCTTFVQIEKYIQENHGKTLHNFQSLNDRISEVDAKLTRNIPNTRGQSIYAVSDECTNVIVGREAQGVIRIANATGTHIKIDRERSVNTEGILPDVTHIRYMIISGLPHDIDLAVRIMDEELTAKGYRNKIGMVTKKQ